MTISEPSTPNGLRVPVRRGWKVPARSSRAGTEPGLRPAAPPAAVHQGHLQEDAQQDVLTNSAQFNKVLDVVGKAMTIDSGGIGLADWAYAMRGIGGDDLLTIKTNNGAFNQSSENRGAEALDRTTLDLLEAVRTDQVAALPVQAGSSRFPIQDVGMIRLRW
ncbi:hypothetical protein ACFFX1_14510 [Dactylosporangium sucinum]|uniref:hypothetical protein n=1 Tax=Dactylosporangium sucinum TaxID=1424081 RepID=UPI0035EE2174